MEYIRPDSKMNRRYMAAGSEVSTGKYETREVLVHDIRPEIENYTLDGTGYQLFHHNSDVSPRIIERRAWWPYELHRPVLNSMRL